MSAEATLRQRQQRAARPDSLQQLYQSTTPQYTIRAQGPPQDLILTEVARALFEVDIRCVSMLKTVLPHVISGRLATDRDNQANAPRDLIEAQDLIQQYESLLQGTHQVNSRMYLLDIYMLRYWSRAENMFRQFFALDEHDPDNMGLCKWVEHLAEHIDRAATDLAEQILQAVRRGQLEPDMQAAIREKWRHLDKISDMFHKKYPNSPAGPPKWSKIARDIDDLSKQSVVDVKWTSNLMWMTFATTIVFTIPILVVAWQYSPHTPGTTKDSDFWFLVQSCGMAIFSLITVAIPMWKGTHLPGHGWYWTWAFMGLAMFLAFAAPFAYAYAPAEWSSLFMIVVSAIQALVTLQLSLVADSGKIKDK